MLDIRNVQKRKGVTRADNYTFIYSGRDKDKGASSGVGLLINNKYDHHIENIEYVNDRILITKLKLQIKNIHIIPVFAPDTNKPEDRAEEYYEGIQIQIDNTKERQTNNIEGLNAINQIGF